MPPNNKNSWALILGGSSGFGLATAKELAERGMNLCIVHRDRRGAMERIEDEFSVIRDSGVDFLSFNLDALSVEGRQRVLEELSESIGDGRVRLLLHSIAYGSLKPIIQRNGLKNRDLARLAVKCNKSEIEMRQIVNELFEGGVLGLFPLVSEEQPEEESVLDEEELLLTLQAMGTSLLDWTRELYIRNLFAPDSRVIGLTSEGNQVSWDGYAAVSAAKSALESISRSIAKEFGPYGIRSNIVQPGVTDTPALRLIPGNARLTAQATLRNPLGRLTRVEDVARVVALLVSDEAAWINGSLIRVDGGEHISGM